MRWHDYNQDCQTLNSKDETIPKDKVLTISELNERLKKAEIQTKNSKKNAIRINEELDKLFNSFSQK